jgi:hypothetical protein
MLQASQGIISASGNSCVGMCPGIQFMQKCLNSRQKELRRPFPGVPDSVETAIVEQDVTGGGQVLLKQLMERGSVSPIN